MRTRRSSLGMLVKLTTIRNRLLAALIHRRESQARWRELERALEPPPISPEARTP